MQAQQLDNTTTTNKTNPASTDNTNTIDISDLPTRFASKPKRVLSSRRVGIAQSTALIQSSLLKATNHGNRSMSPYEYIATHDAVSENPADNELVQLAAAAGQEHDMSSSHLLNSPTLPVMPRNFEYGDHTADIILHGYGSTIEQSFESVAYAMICYMYDHPERLTVHPLLTHDIVVEGYTIQDLTFSYLTEILVQSVDYLSMLPNTIQKEHFSHCHFPGMIPRVITVKSFDQPSHCPLLQSSSQQNNEENSVVDQQSTSNNDKNLTIPANTNNSSSNNTNNNKNGYKSDKYRLVVQIQGNIVDPQELGIGTEIKAITKELTRLSEQTDPKDIKQKGKYHLQVLVDI